jgi:hypothetical protein
MFGAHDTSFLRLEYAPENVVLRVFSVAVELTVGRI